jgi:hypothetical protein
LAKTFRISGTCLINAIRVTWNPPRKAAGQLDENGTNQS